MKVFNASTVPIRRKVDMFARGYEISFRGFKIRDANAKVSHFENREVRIENEKPPGAAPGVRIFLGSFRSVQAK